MNLGLTPSLLACLKITPENDKLAASTAPGRLSSWQKALRSLMLALGSQRRPRHLLANLPAHRDLNP
jgi:hypothetical protein